MPTMHEITFPQSIEVLDKMPGLLYGPKYFRYGEVAIIYTQETQSDGPWHHVSVSCEARYPTWEEMKAIAAEILPGREVVLWVQIPNEPWLNLHPNCFHLMAPRSGRIGRVSDLILPLTLPSDGE